MRIISIFFLWSSRSSESGAAGSVILEGLWTDLGFLLVIFEGFGGWFA
jgi:hypothetical protein